MIETDHRDIPKERPPIRDYDGVKVKSSIKTDFDSPAHSHDEYELNLLINADNALRVVGDSVVPISGMEMVFLGPRLPHAWKRGECGNTNVSEITIHFLPEHIEKAYLERFQLVGLRNMFRQAAAGIAFGNHSVLRFFKDVERLAAMPEGFNRWLHILVLLHELSELNDYTQIAGTELPHEEDNGSQRQIIKVCRYINEHYSAPLTNADLAALVDMPETSFCSFFRNNTGMAPTEYITHVRLGAAARRLVTDPHLSIQEISVACGFNNENHFSRVFQMFKEMTPSEFRACYQV